MAKARRAAKKKGGGMWFSVVVLIVGILYLLVDLAVWDIFAGISCCTAAFILIGVWMLFVRK